MLGEKHVMYEADPALIDSVAFIMFDCLHSVLEQEVIRIFPESLISYQRIYKKLFGLNAQTIANQI